VPGTLGGIGPGPGGLGEPPCHDRLHDHDVDGGVLGYDTAPMEGFQEDKVKELLKIPDSVRVVALLAIGHGSRRR